MISSITLAIIIIAGFLLIRYRKPILHGLGRLFKMERKGFGLQEKKEVRE